MALDESTSPRTHAILGGLMDVHNSLGPGWDADVYREAACIAFAHRAVPFVREARIPLWYKGQLLDAEERAEFIAHGEVLVRLQETASPTSWDEARVRALLRASKLPVGLLVCLGGERMHVRRFARVEPKRATAEPPVSP